MISSDLKYKIVHDLDLVKKIILQAFNAKKQLDLDYVINYRDPYLHLKARDILFNLEGLLRLHLKTKSLTKKEIKSTENCLEFLKRTEDFLGKIHLDLSLKGYDFNLMKEKELSKKTKILYNDWDKKYLKIEKTLSSIQFKVHSKDILKMFTKEIKRIDKKSISLKSFIEVKDLTHEALELGFHEWRRSIRWISIYMQFYKDSFYLDSVKTKFEPKRWSNLKDSDFVNFPNSKAKIRMDKTLFFELSEYIFVSGKVKDKLEIESLLEKRISLLNYKHQADQMFNTFNKSKILKKLLKSIRYVK